VCRRLGHKNAKWHSNKAGKNIAAHNFHALIRYFLLFFSRFGFCGFIADFVLYVSMDEVENAGNQKRGGKSSTIKCK